jgi:hypothetical protein
VGAPDWKITEYRGRGALEQLAADWRRLYAAMPLRSSYHALEAHVAYNDILMAAPDRFRCLALSNGQQVRAICPLEATTDPVLGPALPVWEISRLPHDAVQDVICPEDDARRELLPAVVEYLRTSPQGRPLLVVGPLPTGSALWDGLPLLQAGTHCSVATEAAGAFDCEASYDELMSRLASRFRRNLRNHRKKLDELTGVRFVTAATPPDLARELSAFLKVEVSGWKGPTGSRMAIQLRPKQPAFFGALATTLGRGDDGDHFEINALYIDDHCVASQLCTRTGGQYAMLKIGYDQAYSHLSPGQLLLGSTVQRCCDDPDIKVLNLLSDAAWIRDWRPDTIPLQKTYIGLGRATARPLTALLEFRFGRGREAARWLRGEWQRRTKSGADDGDPRRSRPHSDAPPRGEAAPAAPTRPNEDEVPAAPRP